MLPNVKEYTCESFQLTQLYFIGNDPVIGRNLPIRDGSGPRPSEWLMPWRLCQAGMMHAGAAAVTENEHVAARAPPR